LLQICYRFTLGAANPMIHLMPLSRSRPFGDDDNVGFARCNIRKMSRIRLDGLNSFR